jgi:hypothetical protein
MGVSVKEERMQRILLGWILGWLLLNEVSVARATEIQLSGIAQGEFRDFTEEAGLMISYLPLSPAEPLGILGFDAGLETTFVDIHNDQSYWANATDSDPPSVILIPKLHVQKGLPFGIDVGAVYSKISQLNLSLAGAEIKWAAIAGNAALPAVALRGSYTKLMGVDDLDIETYGADVSVSKGFAFITPYAGVGQTWVRSSENSSLVLEDEQVSLSRAFAGVKITFLVVNLVAEAHFSKVPLYTARVNLAF